MKRPLLTSPLYTTRVRKAGRLVNALETHSLYNSAAIFRKLAPELTKADHLALAVAHRAEEKDLQRFWGKVADRAAKETFGRVFSPWDYRISGVGRHEFSERYKKILREVAHRKGKHQTLAYIHEYVAKHLRKKA